MSNATALSMDSHAVSHSHNASGGRLVATDGRTLPLDRTHVSAEAGGGIARVTLEQRFRNPHDEPLLVTYLVPLPADGAVSGFSFRVGETRIVGEVDTRRAAQERFEQAVTSGKTAALIEQQRSSLFTQQVGNIPPGQEIVCELVIDQPLTWLPEGAWEWRFPTVVGPRYMGPAGRVRDADAITVDVADGKLAVGMTLDLAIADQVADDKRPESPSHPLRANQRADAWDVCFRNDRKVSLDRDVVVRWPVATLDVGLTADIARPSGDGHQDRAYGLLTIVPPEPGSHWEPVPRDLIFLIDTSGSMGGRPLDQAKRVICAMIDTLGKRDRIELIEFGSTAKRWRREPVVATKDGRRQAIKWVKALRASGATEMYDAVIEALSPLRERCQRQIVLVTDGYIGFESHIVAAIRDNMPASCRFHTIGVGSAPNRSLTGPASRAGAGVELVIGMDEDAERVAERMLKRTTAPLITELELSGSAVERPAVARLPDLYAGAPALIPLIVKPDGGTVEVRGVRGDDTGVFEQSIELAPITLGDGNQAIAALYGRERVEELENQYAAMHNMRDVDAEIERIGLDFQIATRLTSWIAVSDDPTIDPGTRLLKQTMPHELPYGAQIEGFGLRSTVQEGIAGFARAPQMFSLTELPVMKEQAGPYAAMSAMPVAPEPNSFGDAESVRLGIHVSSDAPQMMRSRRQRPPVLRWLVMIAICVALGLGLWWLLGGGSSSGGDDGANQPGIERPMDTQGGADTPTRR